MTKKYKVDLVPGDVEQVRENAKPDRVAPVDLEQFAGMTPGKWAYVDARCIPVVTTQHPDKFRRLASSEKTDVGLDTVPTFKAIAALPDIIADLKATREENTRLRRFLQILSESPDLDLIDEYGDKYVCVTCGEEYDDMSDGEDVPTICINPDCIRVQARKLLADLEAGK